MRMLELRGGRDFAAEALGPQRCCEVGIEHLERYAALVLGVAREIDGSHAATAELPLDRVGGAERYLELIEI